MSVSLEQLFVERITCYLDTGITVADEGKAVTLAGNNKVGLGDDGDPVYGKLVKVEADGVGAVEVRGFITLDTAGTAPTAGEVLLVNGAGKVRKAKTGADAETPERTHVVWEVQTGKAICLF